MKVIFLDNDGVICLNNNFGTRFKKQRKIYTKNNPKNGFDEKMPVHIRFDDFDKKAVNLLNDILDETGAEIVVTSDWRHDATLEELGLYYTQQGINKKPIGVTKFINDFEPPENFYWFWEDALEQTRSLEILQYLKEHPEITHWVAVDDLNMGVYLKMNKNTFFKRDWGLENFVLTPKPSEGIKQNGVKEKILKYLT